MPVFVIECTQNVGMSTIDGSSPLTGNVTTSSVNNFQQPDLALPGEDEEPLHLVPMPVLPAGEAGVRRRVEDLGLPTRALHGLHQPAARVLRRNRPDREVIRERRRPVGVKSSFVNGSDRSGSSPVR